MLNLPNFQKWTSAAVPSLLVEAAGRGSGRTDISANVVHFNQETNLLAKHHTQTSRAIKWNSVLNSFSGIPLVIATWHGSS